MKKHLVMGLLGLSLLVFSACHTRVPVPNSKVVYGSTQAIILSPTEGSFYLFDLLTHRIQARIPTGSVPRDLVLGKGGLFFISNTLEHSVSIFQRSDRQTLYRIGKIGLPAEPERMVYDPAEQRLFVLLKDELLMVYETSRGARIPVLKQAIRLPQAAQALHFEPSTKTLYIAGKTQLLSVQSENDNFRVSEIMALPERSVIRDLSFQGEKLLLLDAYQDKLYVVQTKEHQLTKTIALSDKEKPIVLPERMVINHAGSKLYITGQANSAIVIVDLKNETVLQTISLSGDGVRFDGFAPIGIDISPNDQRVYVTSQMGRNISILKTHPDIETSDQLLRNIGTASSEALLLPLGQLKLIQSLE